MNREEIKASFAKFEQEIIELKTRARDVFKAELKELMKKFEIKKVSIPVNNYAFNDGDPEYFEFRYRNMYLTGNDGAEYEGQWGASDDAKTRFEPIKKELVEFFSDFDRSDFYEEMFGKSAEHGEYSRIDIET